MVQPGRFCVADARDVWKFGERWADRAGTRGRRFLLVQEHRHHGKNRPAISRRIFQHLESCELWPAQFNGLFDYTRGPSSDQSFRRPYYDDGNIPAPNSIGIEADFLAIE